MLQKNVFDPTASNHVATVLNTKKAESNKNMDYESSPEELQKGNSVTVMMNNNYSSFNTVTEFIFCFSEFKDILL